MATVISLVSGTRPFYTDPAGAGELRIERLRGKMSGRARISLATRVSKKPRSVAVLAALSSLTL